MDVSAPVEQTVEWAPRENMMTDKTQTFLRPTHVWLRVKRMMIEEDNTKELMVLAASGDLERKVQEFLGEAEGKRV